jgi:hypothetical protein
MKNGFIADGSQRFFRGKKTATLDSLEQKYAKELAAVSPAQKAQIREKMSRDLQRRQNHKPSPGTLW